MNDHNMLTLDIRNCLFQSLKSLVYKPVSNIGPHQNTWFEHNRPWDLYTRLYSNFKEVQCKLYVKFTTFTFKKPFTVHETFDNNNGKGGLRGGNLADI